MSKQLSKGNEPCHSGGRCDMAGPLGQISPGFFYLEGKIVTLVCIGHRSAVRSTCVSLDVRIKRQTPTSQDDHQDQ